MANSELLSYVKQVMDLETSVYTNQRLQDRFSSSMAAQAPIHPQKPKPEIVKMPFRPTVLELNKHMLRLCGIGILLTIVGVRLYELGGLKTIVSIFLVAFGIGFIGYAVKIPGANKKMSDEYAAAMEKYDKEMDAYKKRSAEAEVRNQEQEHAYQSEMAEYNQSMAVFTDECEKSRGTIIEVGNHLKNSLEHIYSANVIYPKYRNLVAVTTIYEYLASGRCDTLEGADGAYNLYEMELRQNIVIGQLSSVLDSLEQIKSNQFTLYSEIAESNRKSAELLSDISDNVEFNRYASEETAKANAAVAQNTEATKYYTLFNAAKRK